MVRRRAVAWGVLAFAIGGVVLMAHLALAAPGDPLGGDDAGCAPDTKDHLKCSDGAMKAIGKAISAVWKCHIKQADLAFKGTPADDETCENGPPGSKSAKDKLDTALAKLATVCAGTPVLANAAMIETQVFAPKTTPGSMDEQNGVVYCDGTDQIDPSGDDAGTVNKTATDAKGRQKCADTVGKSLCKLVGAVTKCHVKLADSVFKSAAPPFDEEGCETGPLGGKSAQEKYNTAVGDAKIGAICTQACLMPQGTRTALGTSQIATLETYTQKLYPCPVATTTTTTTSTTSTTGTTAPSCSPIDPANPAITGLYQTVTLPASDPTAVKICTTGAANATKRFGSCNLDSDCGTGSAVGTCAQTPWVDAGGVTQGTGQNTTHFNVTAGSFPTCEHSVCIQCGALGKCPAIQGGCDSCTTGTGGTCSPSSTNVNCPISDECCQSPGFTLDTILIGAGTLNFCTKVSQFACGVGVINTSNPQTGDNESKREADTSDPGGDCRYGTPDDLPAPGKACCGHGAGGGSNSQAGSCSLAQAFPAQGDDTQGRIKVTKGNGAADASGVQLRLLTPGLATTWSDTGGCPANATFDMGESLVSQLPQSAEPTTAGATGVFVDLNGDGCWRVGAGYTNLPTPPPDGPYTVPGTGPAVLPMPYGGGKFRTATVGAAFSGASPLFDVGFVAITPTGAPTFQGPAQSCSCPAVHTCPECDAGAVGCP